MTVGGGTDPVPEHDGAVHEPDAKQHQSSGKQNGFPRFFLENEENDVQWRDQQNTIMANPGGKEAYNGEYQEMMPLFQPLALRLIDFNELRKNDQRNNAQSAVLQGRDHHTHGVAVQDQEQPGSNHEPHGAAPAAQYPVQVSHRKTE